MNALLNYTRVKQTKSAKMQLVVMLVTVKPGLSWYPTIHVLMSMNVPQELITVTKIKIAQTHLVAIPVHVKSGFTNQLTDHV